MSAEWRVMIQYDEQVGAGGFPMPWQGVDGSAAVTKDAEMVGMSIVVTWKAVETVA